MEPGHHATEENPSSSPTSLTIPLCGSAIDRSRGLKLPWIKQPVPLSPPIDAVETRRGPALLQVPPGRGVQMSIDTTVAVSAEQLWECAVSGEVIDAITDGVASRAGAVERADIVSGLVQEVLEAVAWRCAIDVDTEELESLRRIVDEAEAHRDRMSSRAAADQSA